MDKEILSRRLMDAVLRNDAFEARLRIEAGADVKMFHGLPCGWAAPLHQAAQSGCSEICRLLIEHGADVHAADANGESPLHQVLTSRATHASVARRQSTLQVLLDNGADVHALSSLGATALHLAMDVRDGVGSRMRSISLVQTLMSAGADPFFVPSNSASAYLTPFQQAIKSGNNEVVQFLVEACKPDMRQKSIGGKTLIALCPARDTALKELVRTLVQEATRVARTEGAVINAVGEGGQRSEVLPARSSMGML